MSRFYLCEHCKNLVGLIEDGGVPLMCCGQKMTKLIPNTVDAAGEKHLPVVKKEGNKIVVTVGEVEHPMTEEHYITFIYLATSKGGQRKSLNPTDKPYAEFVLADGEEAHEVYAYCNLHSLWKTEL